MKKYSEPEIKILTFESESTMTTLSGLDQGGGSGTIVIPKDSNDIHIEKVELAF